jgi:acylphosphatase
MNLDGAKNVGTPRRSAAMAVAKKVAYSGNVQGVGFRYTTQRLAGGFAVTGFVRNLPDGDVELVAEGEPEEVAAFLARVGHAMQRYIQDTKVSEEPVRGYSDFGIRH